MIVIDGDSVAEAVRPGVLLEDTWHQRLGASRRKEVLCLAQLQSGVTECLERARAGRCDTARWYILQAGQWAQNHEPIDTFFKSLKALVSLLYEKRVRVCLTTPPHQRRRFADLTPYRYAIMETAATYATAFVDFDSITHAWPEEFWEGFCHFSTLGNAVLAAHFDRPEHQWIGR